MCHDFELPARSDALSNLSNLSNDVADANLRITLAVALGALVLLLTLELEDENLVGAVLGGDGGIDARVAGGFAQQQIARRLAGIPRERDHFTERHFRSDVGGHLGHANHIAGSDAKLLSAGFDNCMHGET